MLTSTQLVEVKSAFNTSSRKRSIAFVFQGARRRGYVTQVSESAMREARQASLDKPSRSMFRSPSAPSSSTAHARQLRHGNPHPERESHRRERARKPVQDAQRDAIKADKDRQRYQQDAKRIAMTCCRAPAAPPQGGAGCGGLSPAGAPLAQGQTARFDQVLAQ